VLDPNVDKLVGNGKKTVGKSSTRIELLKINLQTHHLPQLQQSLVGEPSWIPLCIMKKTLKTFCSVVNEPDRDDAASVKILQEIFNDSTEPKVLKTDIAYIHANSAVTVHTKVGENHIFAAQNKINQ
jgi:hypothetical protein